MEAEKCFSEPERRFRARVSLNKRHELTVKTKCRDTLMQEIFPGKKLQQGTGTDAADKSGICFRTAQHQISIKGTGRGIPVNIAAAPHVRKTVPVKKVRVRFHQTVGVLFESGGNLRLLLIAVPEIPDRRVDVERPAGIIVKRMTVPVPAVSCVIIQNRHCMIPHDIFVNRIAHHGKKGKIQHVEETPVLRNRIPVRIAVQKFRDGILFFFRVRIPDGFFRYPEADDKRCGFYSLLEASEWIAVFCHLASSHIIVISGTVWILAAADF